MHGFLGHKWVCGLVLAAVLVCAVPLSAHAAWVWTPQTGRWINVAHLPKETAELQLEFARSLYLKGDYKKAMKETEKFDKYYADSELADQNQFLRGEIRLAEGKHVAAAKAFQTVIANYPQTELFDDVIAKQYEIGDYLYTLGEKKQAKRRYFPTFKKGPFKKAIEVYSMVIKNAPFTDAAAEAQYKIGLCHQAREEYVEAAFEYRRVIEDYPDSKWVVDATYGLAICYWKASLGPDYDQTPSKLAMEAIDDFARRTPAGDERLADLQEKREVLRENIAQHKLNTAHFYERRRDFRAARIYYNVTVNDYADTKAAEKAQKWLDSNPQKEVSLADQVLGIVQ